jgi:MATE family multidrug resistance protein
MSIQQSDVRRDPLIDEGTEASDAPEVLAEPEPEKASAFSVKAELWTMFQMGWPMVISFACRMAMASTDTAFVGHLDNSTIGTFLDRPFSAKSYLAAGTLTDMVVNVLIVPPLAFNQVLNALVGQALGSGNKQMAGVWLILSIVFLSVSYVPFMVIQYFYTAKILGLLGFSEEIQILATLQSRWNLFWPIPNGIYQCLRFYFQAQGISRPAMWNNLAFVVINGLLNWLFVFGGPFQYLEEGKGGWHGFGFVGAAMSISTSRCLQPLTYWLYMFVWKRAHVATWPGLTLAIFTRDRVVRFLKQALPYIGTLIFQSISGQVTTLMISHLGPLAIAASSAVGAVAQVASSGVSQAFIAVSAVRVGFHLGKGDSRNAQRAMWLVVIGSTIFNTILVFAFWPLNEALCSLVTSDVQVLKVAAALVAAQFVQAGLSQLVSIGTSGVLGGQGRTFIITLLSFGFELPTSIGGVAIMVYVLKWRMPDGMLKITWANAAVALLELVIVAGIVLCSDWKRYAREARARQEAAAAADAEPTVEPIVAAAEPQEEGEAARGEQEE